MFPLWDVVVAPVIRAAQPLRIVEIGALRGETTTLMLDTLGHDVELHVVDPVPDFDPGEHEERFPGRYIFHRDLSVNVLPHLPPMDVAIVDGDHNWYTVYHELTMLRDRSREEGRPLPVLIMHDVLWPYGRRDLYYAPEQIPEEFRQPHDQRGMVPGQSELVTGLGGVSPQMHNALTEGGPRNGVMTAYEDFLAEHDKPVREVIVPIYFGLLIVAEEERLANEPALAKVLDELESTEGRQELLELSEDLRLRAVQMEHQAFNTNQRRIPQLYRRYLDGLKASLLNDHYAENETRLEYLAESGREGRPYDPAVLEDPARRLTNISRRVELRHADGARNVSGESASWLPFAPMGRHRLDHLEQCLDTIRTDRVRGDYVSCGTSRGGDAIFMAGYNVANDTRRRVWVADRFRGPLRAKADGEAEELRQAGDLNFVRDAFDRFDLLGDNVKFLQGELSDTLPDAAIKRIAVLRIEGHDARSVGAALDNLYDAVQPGGYIIVDNYRNGRCGRAVDEFRDRLDITDPIERVDWGGVCWRKRTEVRAAGAETPTVATPARPPLVRAAPADTVDLSVVVVFYNMRREAERTLHSLSRAYQQDIDELDYEVIVVENGSDADQRLGKDYVRSFGPEFHYVDLGDDATSSPVPAVNRGIARARGENLAIMIDGAHVLTPRVLRFGTLGLQTHEPAMVITQQWYVGPGQQPDPAMKDYDQAYEDDLFQKINWPADGYRLFRIGHFIGERDWFDGMSESNCLFVPRSVLQQVGGMDESFSVAGGGYANLELYERIGRQPELAVVSILGEGSFHQVHGGTTTNVTDIEERNRRLVDYRDEYIERKGKPFTGHRKPIHYVGALTQPAKRTRSRRIDSEAFVTDEGAVEPGWRPTRPVPMPDELRSNYVERYWHSLDWQNTSWLGRSVEKAPADMVAYQDMVTRVRPDWIVETGTGTGGRALFLASICDLLGHGRVLSIDAEASSSGRPVHDRIIYLTADPLAADTTTRVREVVGSSPDALVILGADSTERIVSAFGAYAELVPDGSYVVLEDTITGGHPVWNGMGPGPNQAVRDIVKTTSEFVADRHMERFGTTFNPNGYLRRLSGRERSARSVAQSSSPLRRLASRFRRVVRR